MTRTLSGICVAALMVAGMLGGRAAPAAEESRFAMTHSRSQYVHWIELYDAQDRLIDINDPEAPPYSPVHTCGRCHEYDAIAHGFHFNAVDKQVPAGRAGEPWIWTDEKSGTQLPLSYRGWPGTYHPEALGISQWDFVLKFGRQLPGGGAGIPGASGHPAGTAADSTAAPAQPQPETADQTDAKAEKSADDQSPEGGGDEDPIAGRWPLAGQLTIDCMFCHSQDAGYSPEVWWDQIQKQNFAWAPAAALGLVDVEGEVSRAPDDDPTKLPKVKYRPARINGEKKIFFDIVRKPPNIACYYCHTTRVVGPGSVPAWTHDEDVHLRAGFSCSDCHRNGIDHHTVRGFEGEEHATGVPVVTLSCRGCHLGQHTETGDIPGGRMAAPQPEHRGLPPLHLDHMSCTSCHSGPRPGPTALQLQTAMAHGLGLPTHHAGPDLAPSIAGPVLRQDAGVLYPHRVMWPAFWGMKVGSEITPLNPDKAYDAVRKILRVRSKSTFTETLSKVTLTTADKAAALGDERATLDETEWTDEERATIQKLEQTKAAAQFREKLAEALAALIKALPNDQAEPVYVSGGRVYGLDPEGAVTISDHTAAEPYAWYLAHDVRPARLSSGATGCYECHVLGAPIFEGEVAALGPAPDAEPVTRKMYELAGYDKTKLDAWSLSFQGRTAFKWFAAVSTSIVGLVILAFLLTGINGLFGGGRRGN